MFAYGEGGIDCVRSAVVIDVPLSEMSCVLG